MKKVRNILAMLMIVALSIVSIPFSAGATSSLKNDDNVKISVSCDKKGYTFEIYQVATLYSTTSNPYETKYNSNVPEIADTIKDGNTKDALSQLDSIDTLPSGAKSFGAFDTDKATEKTFTDLPQGIYYIRATEYPADVTKVENSILALPYYTSDKGWVYSYDTIELAKKVVETPPSTRKEITNSTKDNVNYTDVSFNDKIDFRLYNTVTGSKQIKLTTYTVYDEMSKGLSLDSKSFSVYLADKDMNKIADIQKGDYTLNITKAKAGEQTDFNVALSKDYLAKNDFYENNVAYLIVDYSANLNKYAIIGKEGNPNTDTKLEYGNRSKTSYVEGNTVYVYTYCVRATKYDEKGNKLAGAEFALYKTIEDATAQQNEIAVGTSDSDGKVVFIANKSNNEIRLQSSKYYVVETKAPEGYNLYGKVIEINAEATYNDTIVNGTYVNQCPDNGIATVDVTDSKVTLPQTGGHVIYFTFAGIALIALGGISLTLLKKKRN